MSKKNAFGFLYSVLLVAFSVYVILDTFVITRVYSAAAETGATYSVYSEADSQAGETTEYSTESTGVASAADSATAVITPVVSDDAYQDANISVTLTEFREYDSTVYVADVQVASPEYLKTALAQNLYGKNVTSATSDIAESNDAILAINGDYYGARESGYVLRNGILYRSEAGKNREDLVIYEDGSFDIINESEVAAEELLEDGAVQILSFGPALVIDGEISVTEDEEVGKAKASNPRTAIGIIDDLHYVLVVSDGRTDESEGLSLYQLAGIMKELGAQTAYNLDGGGSSTMYFNGEVVNNPTSGRSIKERSVSDIVYIG